MSIPFVLFLYNLLCCVRLLFLFFFVKHPFYFLYLHYLLLLSLIITCPRCSSRQISPFSIHTRTFYLPSIYLTGSYSLRVIPYVLGSFTYNIFSGIFRASYYKLLLSILLIPLHPFLIGTVGLNFCNPFITSFLILLFSYFPFFYLSSLQLQTVLALLLLLSKRSFFFYFL